MIRLGLIIITTLLATTAYAGPWPWVFGSDGKSVNLQTGIALPQATTPSNNPVVGRDYLYFKSDDNLYMLDHAGTEVQITGGGGGSGTVTSVGLTTPSWLTVGGSPITSSGTLAITGTSESGNLFLASPNGSSGAMTPRAIASADIPSLSSIYLPLTGGTLTGSLTGIPGSASSTSYNFGTAGTGYFGTATTLDFSLAGTKVAEFNSNGLSIGANSTQWSLFNSGSNYDFLDAGVLFFTYNSSNTFMTFGYNATGNRYNFLFSHGSSDTNPALQSVGSTTHAPPTVNVLNSNGTAGNYEGMTTAGSSTNPNGGVYVFNDIQTSGSETSHCEFWNANAGTFAKKASLDKSGNLAAVGALASGAPQTTLTGSAGTAILSESLQGSSHKEVVIYLSGYTDTGTQVYTFPVAFSHSPYVYGSTGGVAGATATTTTVTFTATTQTGFVFLEGF